MLREVQAEEPIPGEILRNLVVNWLYTILKVQRAQPRGAVTPTPPFRCAQGQKVILRKVFAIWPVTYLSGPPIGTTPTTMLASPTVALISLAPRHLPIPAVHSAAVPGVIQPPQCEPPIGRVAFLPGGTTTRPFGWSFLPGPSRLEIKPSQRGVHSPLRPHHGLATGHNSSPVGWSSPSCRDLGPPDLPGLSRTRTSLWSGIFSCGRCARVWLGCEMMKMKSALSNLTGVLTSFRCCAGVE